MHADVSKCEAVAGQRRGGRLYAESIKPNADAARLKLEARIRRHYHLRWIPVEAVGETFQIAKVADPNSVFEEAMYDEKRQGDTPLEWQPYWAEAWESSVVLAQVVAEQGCQGQTVLDLGCGVGVVGAIAAGLGAQVMMGDIALPGLLFCQLNAWPWRERAVVRRIDWENDRLKNRFDCIANADVVYDRRNWPALDRFWRHHLAPGGVVLVTEPNRISGREFRAAIVEMGWHLDGSLGVRRSGEREIVISRLKPRY